MSEFITTGGIHVTSDEAFKRVVPDAPPEDNRGEFEKAASRVSLIEGFADPDLAEKIFSRAIEQREMTIPEVLLVSMAGSLFSGMNNSETMGAAGAIAPTGSSKSDWAQNGESTIGLTPAQRMTMWRRSRELGTKDGMIFSLLRRMVVHICGKGPWIFIKKKENAGPEETKRYLALVSRQQKLFPNFAKLVRLIVWQTLMNGTLPVINFPIDGYPGIGSRPQVRPLIPDTITKMHIKDGWSLWPVVEGCTFNSLRGKREDMPGGYVPRKAVTIFRIHEEGNDGVWGLSVPFHIITELSRYMDWLEQRRLKSRVDNMAIIIRYLKSTEVMTKREVPNRPMVIDAPMDEEKWDVLNTGGASSRDATGGDGREFRLRMAAASGWAEHYLTGDAQYAAQMGKDAFPVFLLEYYQETIEGQLVEMAAKTLGCSRADIEIVWPPVDMRDRSAKVSEVQQLFKERIISRAQVHRDLGYDHTRNEKELEDELNAELTSGPSGGASNFGGMSSLFPSSGAPPQSMAPGGGSPAPNIPMGAEVTMPSAGLAMSMKSFYVPETLGDGRSAFVQASIPADAFAGKMVMIGGDSDMGISTDAIIETIPEMKPGPTGMVVGTDYGYAAEGAAVFGGESVDGDLVVVGEATYKRVKSSEQAGVYKKLKEQYPQLVNIYTGSDEPELTDTLNEAGFKAELKHIGEDRTRALISGSERRVLIHYQCVEVLSDLFPDLASKIAGTNVAGRHDHKDAFRYWLVGLLEMLNINEKI